MVLFQQQALAIIDWLKGDEITIIEDDSSSGLKKIHVNNRSVDCSEDVAKLVNNPRVRKSIEEFIREPLQNPGTSSFAVKKRKSKKI